MASYLPYAFRYYARSYRYIAPLVFFFVAVSMFYKDPTNQVLSSLSFGNFIIFVACVWLANGYIELEDETQQQITILHMGSVQEYFLAKLGFISIVAIAVAVYAYFYPFVFHIFTVGVAPAGLLVGFAASAETAMLGVSVGIFFNNRLIAKKSRGILLLFMVTVLSLAGRSIVGQLPHSLQFISFIFPPVSQTVFVVGNWWTINLYDRVAGLVWPIIYSFLCTGLYLKLTLRKLYY